MIRNSLVSWWKEYLKDVFKVRWHYWVVKLRLCPTCIAQVNSIWQDSVWELLNANDLLLDAAIRPGDVVLGLASSGFHSNGYSLIRKAVFEYAGLSTDSYIAELQQSVAEVLLEPTRIYTRALREVLNYYSQKTVIHGLAHITGGGLAENLSRILPENRKSHS